MTISFLRPLALTTALSLGVFGNAGANEYTSLNPQASRISFGYSQMNVSMDGHFGDMKATEFSFDPAKPETDTVAIEIPLASIEDGYAEAYAELEKNDR